MKKKRTSPQMRRPMLWLLGIALAARILPVAVHFVIGTDEGLFLTLAQNLAAGREYTGNGRIVQSDFPPGFPLFAAAIYKLGGGLELPSQLNTLLIGGLLPLPVFWLASRLAAAEGEPPDEKTGFRAGLFTALMPALVLGTSNFEATAEPLYSLFLYTGWAALWWGISRGARDERLALRGLIPFLLAGLAVGAAHIVRWEGVILGLIGAGAIVVSLRRRAILPGLVFLAGLGAFAVPYALFLHLNAGTYVNPKTSITRLHAAALEAEKDDPFAFERYYYDLEDVLADPVGLSHVPAALTQNNVPLARRLVSNLLLELRLLFTTASLMTVVWIGPALAGLWALWPRGRALYLIVLFLPLGAILASVVDPRYFLPTLPAAMILAAVGWKWIEGRWGQRQLVLPGAEPSRSLPVAAALIAATLAVFTVFDLAAPFLLPRPTEYRSAGLALRGQLPVGAHMLARKRQAPFYAGAIWEWLPFADLPEVLDYAAAHDADYILLDKRTTLSLRPQLASLLDPANAPDSLTAIYYDAPNGVVVYFINRQP